MWFQLLTWKPQPTLKEQNTANSEGSFMKKLVMILFAAISLSAFAADTTVKGYLVDLSCAREEGQKPGFGAKHTKGCLQMEDCEKSGYGVMTDDKKVIRFDKAGNEEAKKFIASLTKKNDIKVTVDGAVNGDNMTVSKIALQ
jgi:hypothetical protein